MRYGLIGEKLGHSFSVPIHQAFGTEDYALCSLAPEELDGFLKERAFLGLNVTIPYKKTVMPYCDEIDAHAEAIGCVNTLVLGRDGVLRGYNTDYAGFAVMAERAGIDFSGREVLILGTGGASLTARAVAEAQGAALVRRVSRSGAIDYENVYELAHGTEILINTTPVGMYPLCGRSPVELSRFTELEGVLDVVYNPRRTALVQQAEALGLRHGDGLVMLVEQARRAEELFGDRAIPAKETDRIFAGLSRSLENLILIGMPGCGKSTVGALLARELGRELVDSDEEIVKKAGMSIPEIFEKYGEAHFRSLEREVIASLGAKNGLVIATGGGAPVDVRNHAPLRQNGRIYYIRRSLDRLARDGRPLSSSPETLKDMYAARKGFYESLCDLAVFNDGAAEETAARIKEDFLNR